MRRLIFAIFISMFLVHGVGAQDQMDRLPAASDKALRWLLFPVPKPTPETSEAAASETVKLPPFQILLHKPDRDEPGQWSQVTQIRGDLQASSLAAMEEHLFVVLGSSHVYRLQRQGPPPGTMLRDVVKMVVQPKLPVEGQVISAMANAKGYHVILEPKMTVERLVDGKQTSDQLPQDPRLVLSLHRNKWTQSHLPEVVLDWDDLQLLPVGRDGKLAYVGKLDGKVWMATLNDEHWQVKALQFEPTKQDQLSWFNIDGHLLVASHHVDNGQLDIQTNLIVEDRVLELGSFEVPSESVTHWALLTMDQKIGLVTSNGSQQQMTLRTLDFQGEKLPEPIAITVGDPVNDLNQPGRWIVLVAMMLGMLLFLSVWHRNPAVAKVTTPEGYEIAMISKRFLALMIDLAPSGLISSYIFGITMQELVDQWPGMGITWDQLLPGLVTIAIFTVHTTVSEIFTAQTIGKKMMGISVFTTQGKAPDVWQVILRNLLKVLDLIAWYVLPFLVIISAYRQRLGDVVARTVVVQPKPDELEE